MGVDCTIYLMHGVKIDWDDDLNEALNDDPLYAAMNDSMVLDAMGGEYMWFGNILASGDYAEAVDYVLDPETFVSKEAEYRAKFKKLLPDFEHLIKDKKFEYHFFSHYS